MSEIQQGSLSEELLAHLDRIDLDDALSFLHSRQMATPETATALVFAALGEAEKASRAARHWLVVAAALNRQMGGDTALEAQISYAQARVHLQLGELQEAEAALYTARSHWTTLNDQAALARSYLGMTQILAMQGRFDDAEAAIRQAIELLPQQSIQRAWAYSNLANLLDRRGDYKSALAGYDQAQKLLIDLQSGADEAEIAYLVGELAEIDLNRANVLVALDLPNEAEKAYMRARNHFGDSGDVVQQGRLECNLGSLYLRTGRYADALRSFDKAEVALLGNSLLTDTMDEAQLRQADILLLDQANAYLALNLRNEAMTTLDRCQTLFRSADQPYELAQSLYLIGLLYLRHGDLDSGKPHLHEAYEIFDNLDNTPWRNRTELALAQVEDQSGASTAAAARLDRLLRNFATHSQESSPMWTRDLSTTVEASLLRLQLHLSADEFAQAQHLADQVERLLASTVPLPHLRQRLAFARGSIEMARGSFDDACTHFYAALHILEDQRTSLLLEEFRTAYLTDKYHIYAGLVLGLLHEDEPSQQAIHDAFNVIERARARSLHERLQTTQTERSDADGAEADFSADNSTTDPRYSKLHWLYNQIFEASSEHTVTRQELHTYETLLERLAWKSASPTSTNGQQLSAQAQPVSLQEFQQSLSADQQALLYYIVQPTRHTVHGQGKEGEVLAFLVERDRVHLYRHLCTSDVLAQAQSELRFQLGRVELGPAFLERHRERLASSLQQALHRLHTLLLAPIVPDLWAPRLLLIPYGPLHLMPFHALWDGERHLIECFTCSYAPSASVTVQRMQRVQAMPYQSFAGLAITDPMIPQARREVELAARSFAQSHLFLDEAAGRAGLAQAAQSDVLHIATHGLFRPDNPFFSSLKLADGWIDVRGIYRLPLAARLVILSACDSGSGDIRGGDEVIGLARGFLGAGAKDLVVSLWNVHDARAAELMSTFYSYLSTGATPAVALQSAQKNFIEQGIHAYYWASFLSIGV